jgi:hypothetical protein
MNPVCQERVSLSTRSPEYLFHLGSHQGSTEMLTIIYRDLNSSGGGGAMSFHILSRVWTSE